MAALLTYHVTQLVPLIERVPSVRGKVDRPRQRPQRATAERGYDHDKDRRELHRRGIGSEIARRQTEHGSGLGRALDLRFHAGPSMRSISHSDARSGVVPLVGSAGVGRRIRLRLALSGP